MKRGERIWIEDDATALCDGWLDIYSAWAQLFGEELNFRTAITMKDLGDAFEYLMPNGKIVVLSYPGNSAIYEAVEESP